MRFIIGRRIVKDAISACCLFSIALAGRRVAVDWLQLLSSVTNRTYRSAQRPNRRVPAR